MQPIGRRRMSNLASPRRPTHGKAMPVKTPDALAFLHDRTVTVA